jgi:DNA invertase Pin-like site-specific DNA recombinase
MATANTTTLDLSSLDDAFRLITAQLGIGAEAFDLSKVTVDEAVKRIAAERRLAGLTVKHAYIRVSTGEQNIDSQKQRLTEAGCTEFWIDHGVSGVKGKDLRPKLKAMLLAVQPGDEVWITKLDRLGRSVVHLFDIAHELDEKEIRLKALDAPLDTRDPFGRFLFGMLAVVAAFERDLIVERTYEGQAAVRRAEAPNMRRIMGGVPTLGYCQPEDANPGDKSRDWAKEPRAWEFLADMAARVMADPQHRVMTAFKAKQAEDAAAGLPPLTDAGGAVVNFFTIRNALIRPASAGIIEVRGVKYGNHPLGGPIPMETYHALRGQFARRERGRPPVAGVYPFGKLLFCHCGNQLSGKPVRKQPHYGCNNKHKINGEIVKPCFGVSVPAEEVHELLAISLGAWAETDDGQKILAEVPKANTRRGELLAQIAEDQATNDAYLAKKDRRHISARDYLKRSAEIEARIDVALAELDALEEAESAGSMPQVFDWGTMTDVEKYRLVEVAVQTPIVVRPRNGTGASLSVAERVTILPLSAPPAA